MSFLPWVRIVLNDETIMGMKRDDFVGKPRPNRAGKKQSRVITAQAGKEEEDDTASSL